MYCFEVGKLIVVRVDADAEEQAGIPSVDYAIRPEFDKVRLVFLVSRSYKAMNLYEVSSQIM